MKVMKLTTVTGQTFFNADHSPDLIAATLKRLPKDGWKSLELIEMTEEEYFRIPATNESARLWE